MDDVDRVPVWLDDRTLISRARGGFETVDVKTGETTAIDLDETIPDSQFGRRFSNDFRWLYYSWTEVEGDIWVLDAE